MKRTVIWIALLSGMMLVGGVACNLQPEGLNPSDAVGAKGGNDQVAESGLAESALVDSESTAEARELPVLFSAPQFELTDELGMEFSSEQLLGRVWVANFMFTNCLATCPRQAAKMLELQTRTSHWPHGRRLRFLSFTVDPERDTPARLSEYARQCKAEPARWKFLTGNRTDLWELSNNGFKFPVASSALNSSNPFIHSSRFVLVDAMSRVRGVYESLHEEDITKLVGDLQLVLSEPIRDPPDPIAIGLPADVFDLPWLPARHAAQLASADSIEAFHDFQFEDRVEASGISFVDRPVGDVAKNFKSNHYDHANGIAAGDVDGDGLTDLYFTCQRGGNQLWRNLGEGQFENITEFAGVGLEDRVSVTASFADIDNDGDPDLFVTTTRQGNALFVNDGQGRFEDQTIRSGLSYRGHSSSADFFDYDNDGLLDLLVSNVGKFTTDEIDNSDEDGLHNHPYYVGTTDSFAGHLFPALSERSLLYHNDGGNVFSDASEITGFRYRGWAGDATPIDANSDGWTDLYILNMQGNDTYFENQEGKRFVDKSREMFPVSVWGGMGVKSFDYNNDGLMDLYVTNMHADMWQLNLKILGAVDEKKRAPPNTVPESYLQSRIPWKNVIGSGLFVRQIGGGFREIATEVNADNYWPWGPSVADLNADGFQDLFVASCMNYPYRYHVNSLLINEGGNAFRDAEFILGVEPRKNGKTAVPWFQLDSSGADIAHEHSQGRSGTIEVWGAVGTRSSAIFDLDLDGDLDIVTNEFNSPPMVLISNLSEQTKPLHYLAIQLRGVTCNRDGLGARIELKLAERTLTQVHDGQSGYLSQSSLPLYFGLGEADSVDRMTIAWPGNRLQVIEGPIPANQLLLIEQQ